jgi:hypothetical protein
MEFLFYTLYDSRFQFFLVWLYALCAMQVSEVASRQTGVCANAMLYACLPVGRRYLPACRSEAEQTA